MKNNSVLGNSSTVEREREKDKNRFLFAFFNSIFFFFIYLVFAAKCLPVTQAQPAQNRTVNELSDNNTHFISLFSLAFNTLQQLNNTECLTPEKLAFETA